MAEKIPHVISSEAGQVPTIHEIRLAGGRCYHPCVVDGAVVSFPQHLEAARAAGKAMLEDFIEDTKNLGQFESVDITQAAFVEVALVKGRVGNERKVAKAHIKVELRFDKALEDQLAEALGKLPKLLYSLRKAFNNKAANLICFSLEYTIKTNAATLKQISDVLRTTANKQKVAVDSLIAELKKTDPTNKFFA